MNENIDLTKILKDCPKGTKFYSSIYGDLLYSCMYSGSFGPKITFIKPDSISSVDYYPDGKRYSSQGECTLFPSKDQRDWSKFTSPWYKNEEKQVKPKFKVGDKIVNGFMKYMGAPGAEGTISKIIDDKYIFTDGSHMFINNQDSWNLVFGEKPKFDPKTLQPFDKVLVKSNVWKCGLFSHIKDDATLYKYSCVGDAYEVCIPYNDDTKHLLGTNEEAPDYYKYWEE